MYYDGCMLWFRIPFLAVHTMRQPVNVDCCLLFLWRLYVVIPCTLYFCLSYAIMDWPFTRDILSLFQSKTMALISLHIHAGYSGFYRFSGYCKIHVYRPVEKVLVRPHGCAGRYGSPLFVYDMGSFSCWTQWWQLTRNNMTDIQFNA